MHACATTREPGRGVTPGNMLEALHREEWSVRVDPVYIGSVSGGFSNLCLPAARAHS